MSETDKQELLEDISNDVPELSSKFSAKPGTIYTSEPVFVREIDNELNRCIKISVNEDYYEIWYTLRDGEYDIVKEHSFFESHEEVISKINEWVNKSENMVESSNAE